MQKRQTGKKGFGNPKPVGFGKPKPNGFGKPKPNGFKKPSPVAPQRSNDGQELVFGTNFNLGQKRKSEETMQKHYMVGESLYGGIHESMQMQRMDAAHGSNDGFGRSMQMQRHDESVQMLRHSLLRLYRSTQTHTHTHTHTHTITH